MPYAKAITIYTAPCCAKCSQGANRLQTTVLVQQRQGVQQRIIPRERQLQIRYIAPELRNTLYTHYDRGQRRHNEHACKQRVL